MKSIEFQLNVMDLKEKEKTEAHEGAWAAAGFAIVLVVVGLPVWWHTTTVYRAALPCNQIDKLAADFIYHTIHLHIYAESIITAEKYVDQFRNLDRSKGISYFF